ncbi:Transducin (beta)-like 3, partial [Kappamyces sp. JEL0680]
MTGEVEFTIPTFESIETLAVVTPAAGELAYGHESVLVTGGDRGTLRVWDPETGEALFEQPSKTNTKFEISFFLWKHGQLVVTTSDQNIYIYGLLDGEFDRQKMIAGYNEEILDLALVGAEQSHLVLISNSEQVRLYDIESKDYTIVQGHSDIVLTAAASFDGSLLATGSKDNTCIVWAVDAASSLPDERLVAQSTLKGHTSHISALGFTQQSNKYLLSASQDRTVKCWDLKTNKTRYTFQAHDNDIQGLDVAPNDSCFASCSLDKTVKIWNMDDGSLLGTCTGHKRGVWKVKFSPIDQALATCSTDKTIRVWSLRDFTCIRTFEGHLNSVLNVGWLSVGLQLVSTGSDGLVKIWNAKDGECVGTFDNHEDRVRARDSQQIWALA